MDIFRQFASTAEPADGGLIGVLGIDWMMLIFQIVAFLILVWLLGKFVYPWLLKSIDDRQAKIDASVKAATDAQESALESERKTAKLLEDARLQADDIIATAKSESSALLTAAEDKSKKRAEQIAADAHEQISKDILAAKKMLHNETIELVAMATEKIIGKAVSKSIDNDLIKDALKAVKK